MISRRTADDLRSLQVVLPTPPFCDARTITVGLFMASPVSSSARQSLATKRNTLYGITSNAVQPCPASSVLPNHRLVSRARADAKRRRSLIPAVFWSALVAVALAASKAIVEGGPLGEEKRERGPILFTLPNPLIDVLSVRYMPNYRLVNRGGGVTRPEPCGTPTPLALS